MDVFCFCFALLEVDGFTKKFESKLSESKKTHAVDFLPTYHPTGYPTDWMTLAGLTGLSL